MRAFGLFVATVIIGIPAFAGDSASTINSKDAALFQQSATPLDISKFRLRPKDVDRGDNRPRWVPPEEITLQSDPVCFTMRTYVAEREAQDSDVTRMVGSSSCQQSSKYKLKTTEVRVH
jgi:hypothetical protein